MSTLRTNNLKNTTANRRLHQLLGLRLRFSLRGKYSGVFNYIFQFNFVDLFWSVPAAATECKRPNVRANFNKKCYENKILNFNKVFNNLNYDNRM